MIFTGLKRKSHQIFFNKRLVEFTNKQLPKSREKIFNVFFFTDDLSSVDAIKKNLSEHLRIAEDTIQYVVFQHKNKAKNKDSVVAPKDFGWYGKVKTEVLKSFLTKKIDLLINYCKVENIYVNNLILQSKSEFRVGLIHQNEVLYDLIINCDSENVSVINKEILKYLTILKKL